MNFNVNLEKKNLSEIKLKKKNPHQNQLSAIAHYVIHCSEYLKDYQREPAVCNCLHLSFTVRVKPKCPHKNGNFPAGLQVFLTSRYHTGLKQRG